jgi:hypothetical protein
VSRHSDSLTSRRETSDARLRRTLGRELGEPAAAGQINLLLRIATERVLPVRCLLARQYLDHPLPHTIRVGESSEDLNGGALALTDEPQKEVLGTYVVVAELLGLAERQLEHFLRSRRERHASGLDGGSLSKGLDHTLADRFERDVERLKRTPRDALFFVDEAKQDVLGADPVVVEHPRLFLSEDDHPSGGVGEPLEHRASIVRLCPSPNQIAGS